MVRGRCLGIRQLSSSFATLFFPNAMVKAHRHICRNIFEISIMNLQTYANMISCYLLFSFCFSLSLFVYAVFYAADLNRESFMLLRQLYGVSSLVNEPLGSAAQLSKPSSVHCWFNGQRPNCESLRCSSCSVPLWGLGFSLPRGL